MERYAMNIDQLCFLFLYLFHPISLISRSVSSALIVSIFILPSPPSHYIVTPCPASKNARSIKDSRATIAEIGIQGTP